MIDRQNNSIKPGDLVRIYQNSSNTIVFVIEKTKIRSSTYHNTMITFYKVCSPNISLFYVHEFHVRQI